MVDPLERDSLHAHVAAQRERNTGIWRRLKKLESDGEALAKSLDEAEDKAEKRHFSLFVQVYLALISFCGAMLALIAKLVFFGGPK